MKVLLLNGSPHKNGCVYTVLNEIAMVLNQENIETTIYSLGTDVIAECRGCFGCWKLKKCVINDKVNEFIELAKDYDGFVFGSPVHFASASGSITAFLDRVFMAGNEVFRYKPATAIATARRAGTTATLDQLNKYMSISQMPIISGRYWNMVHGGTPAEVKQDLEGMQNMRILARNMAYFLKCKKIAEQNGITPPTMEEVVFTNFIR